MRPDTIETASKIHYSLLSHATEKEKFESTADYTKRMLVLRDQILFDEVKVGGAHAFEISSTALRVTYDADRQQFSVEVSPRSDASHRFELIELERRSVPPNTAEVEYFLTKGKTIEATQVVYARVPTLKGLTYPRGSVTVAPAQAREMEHRLRVLLVGELQPPYTQVDKKYPFDHDDNTSEYQNILVMKAPAFWLVDSRNGNVLTKQFTIKRAV